MRIIPAIDIIDGKCVRLSQGDYATKKVYSEDPVEVAKAFESAGIQYLHVVDLDGAKAGKVINWQVLKRICNETSLNVDFGGGLRSDAEVESVFKLGVKQITGGSIAVKEPGKFLNWLNSFGPEKIILGLDVKDENIAIHGWTETTTLSWRGFLEQYIEKGLQYIICTDISRDGALTGPAIDLYKNIQNTFPEIKLIASGGVANISDIEQLKAAGLEGVIFGKAFYEGRITIKELTGIV